MLRLVVCEFWKLKRRRLFSLAFLTTFILPCMYLMILQDKSLDNLMSVVREENGFLLLLPLTVVLAANLFFGESDQDTLKNLMCVPVSKTGLAAAKLFVLLLFDVCYELAGALVGTLFAACLGAGLEGLAVQLAITLGTGILLWATAMPCILLVVWCNQSYMISVIAAFAYTVANFILRVNDRFMMAPLGFNVQTVLPVPMIGRWLYQYHPIDGVGGETLAFYERFRPYFVPTPVIFAVLLAEAACCAALLTRVYRKLKKEEGKMRSIKGGRNMCAIIKTEFLKMRRCHILLIGLLGMVCSPLLQFFSQMALTQEARNVNFDFAALAEDTVWGSATIFMPVMFVLVGGWLINREYVDDTLKNIFTVPLSFRKFLAGKLAAFGLLALCFGVFCFAVTVVVAAVGGLSGITLPALVRVLAQMAALSVCIYVIVLPVIAICGRRQGLFMSGAVIAFIAGYCSLFFKGGLLRNVYPFLAGLRLIGFDSSAWIGAQEAGSFALSALSMGVMALVSVIIVATARMDGGRKRVQGRGKKRGRGRR